MIEMSNPGKIHCEDKIKYFGGYGGHLILILAQNPPYIGFEILEMDKDDGRWMVECEVDLWHLIAALHRPTPDWYRNFFCAVCCQERGTMYSY